MTTCVKKSKDYQSNLLHPNSVYIVVEVTEDSNMQVWTFLYRQDAIKKAKLEVEQWKEGFAEEGVIGAPYYQPSAGWETGDIELGCSFFIDDEPYPTVYVVQSNLAEGVTEDPIKLTKLDL